MANEHSLKSRIINKHDLEANWLKAANFIPKRGETIYYDPEVDESGNVLEGAHIVEEGKEPYLPGGRTSPMLYARQKVGDGIRKVSDLPFIIDEVVTSKVNEVVADKDIFEIDMLTVNAHGGVAAGEDLNGLTTKEILKKILYPYVQPTVGNATATPNGGTYEKGTVKTITQVSITVTKKSEPITSVALYNGSSLISEKTGSDVKDGGTIKFTNLSFNVPTDGNQLTVKVTDAKGTVQEKKTTSMSFVYPYYVGSCASGTTINESLVESLTKKIESKGNKSNEFSVTDGHMVFAYPKSYGVLKSILDPNNFETISGYKQYEVSVTGLDNTAQTYYVYVSNATTVNKFNVTFKY